MNYFETVGREIEASLASLESSTSFADIATKVLRDIEPPAHLDYARVLDWIGRQSELPLQCNDGSFGQPTIVVYHHESFYVELIVWFPSSTATHGHGFEGAFRVLRGASLQAEYAFDLKESPCEGIQLGKLTLESVEMIGPNDVSTISRGDRFVHKVAHLGNPSLTLVARTHAIPDPVEHQFTYYQSGLAFAPHWRAESINRQIKALKAIRRVDPQQFRDHLRRFLASGDMHRRLICLLNLSPSIATDDWETLLQDEHIIGNSSLELTFTQTLAEARREHKMQKALARFPDSAQHLEISLGALLGVQAQKNEVLERFYPGEPIFEKWQKIVAAEY